MNIKTNIKHVIVLFAVITITTGLAFVIGAPTVNAQFADGTIETSPTDTTLEANDTKTIAIQYENIAGESPQAIAYTLSYDKNVISVTNQEPGPYLGDGIKDNSISTPGEVVYRAVADENINESNNTIATITIEPVCGIDNSAETDVEIISAGAAKSGERLSISRTNTNIGTVSVVNSTTSCNENDGSEDNNNEESGSDNSDNSGDSAGGAGGAGGGGAGGGGAGGDGPTGPPTPEQVANTLNLIGPEDTTTLGVATASEESTSGTNDGSTGSDADSADASGTSVQEVIFENTDSQPVSVADYGEPPETVEDEVINSIAADNEEIATASGDKTSSSEGSRDGSSSEPAKTDVVQLVKIEPTEEISDEAQAEVKFSVDRDKITNPNSLIVYKDAYVFEAQEEQWVEAETTVTEVTDDSIEVTASVDEFSLFAVMEIDDSSAKPTATPDTDETSEDTQTDDGIPGFGVGITLVAVVVLSMVIRVNRLRK